MPVYRPCSNCGAIVKLTPSRADAYARSFCNVQCMTEYNTGKSNPNWKGGLVLGRCLVCGKETRVKRSHVKNGEGKFCSRTCKGKWKTMTAIGYDPLKRIVKECVICGAKIRVKKSHADYEGTYCSRACMAQGYSERLVGEANPHYHDGKSHTKEYRYAWSREWRRNHKERVRHWNRQSKAARKDADGQYTEKDIAYHWHQQRGECVYCGIGLDDGYHVDHIIPISRGGTNYVGNIQLLCPSCNLRKAAMLPMEFRVKEGLVR